LKITSDEKRSEIMTRIHKSQKPRKIIQSKSVKGVAHKPFTPKIAPMDALLTKLVGMEVSPKVRAKMESMKAEGKKRTEIARLVELPKFYVNMILGGSA
jgi:hypothetical protein